MNFSVCHVPLSPKQGEASHTPTFQSPPALTGGATGGRDGGIGGGGGRSEDTCRQTQGTEKGISIPRLLYAFRSAHKNNACYRCDASRVCNQIFKGTTKGKRMRHVSKRIPGLGAAELEGLREERRTRILAPRVEVEVDQLPTFRSSAEKVFHPP